MSICFVEVRGFQADAIINDEGAYQDETQYNNTILPHKGNDFMWCMSITSPATDTNHYSRRMNVRDALGRLVSRTIMAGTACKNCRRLKRAADCEHKKMPPWKSKAGIAEVKAILGHDVATFNREMQGVVIGVDVRIYAEFVSGFRKQPLYHFVYPVRLINAFIDPAGGGAGSDFTIVSGANEQGTDAVSHKCR